MRTLLLDTFFYTALTNKPKETETEKKPKHKPITRYERVKSWTKNVNVLEKDFIFIPINEK